MSYTFLINRNEHDGFLSPRKLNGFTLLEMLVAITIAVMTGVAVASVFSSAIRAHNKGQKLLRLSEQGYVILSKIENDLCNIIRFSPHQLTGDTHTISFTSNTLDLTADSQVPRISFITYMLDEVEQNRLYRVVLRPGHDYYDSSLVCQNIEIFEITYAGLDDNRELTWGPNWPAGEGNIFPVAIHLELTLAERVKGKGKDVAFERTIFLAMDEFEN